MPRLDRSQHGAMWQQLNGQQITETWTHPWQTFPTYSHFVNLSSRHQPNGLYGYAQMYLYQPFQEIQNSASFHNPISVTMHPQTPQFSTPVRAYNNGIWGYGQQTAHHRNQHGSGQHGLTNQIPPQTPLQSTVYVPGSEPFSMRLSLITADLNDPHQLQRPGLPYRIEDFLRKDAREEYQKDRTTYDTYFRALIRGIINNATLKFPYFNLSHYNYLG